MYCCIRYHFTTEWFLYCDNRKKRHRKNNLPAIIQNFEFFINNERKLNQYWFNGEIYLQQENGTKEWYSSPSYKYLNRENDLPAVEYPNGDKEWWENGIRHRLNGPAVIIKNKKFWFKWGVFVKQE